jgi:hypothetical protein
MSRVVAGRLDLGAMRPVHVGVTCAVESRERPGSSPTPCPGRDRASSGGRRFPFDERQVGADVLGHRAIERALRHLEGVRRAIVAVHAVHRPVLASLELLGRRLHLGRDVLDRLSRVVDVSDDGDDLPMGVGCDVGDARGVVEMASVDPDASLEGPAADLDEKDVLGLGVRGVGSELRVDEELVPDEALRPVAALASLAGWAQVLDGRGDRSRVRLQRHGEHLANSRDLGAHEPRRAGPDVTFDAGDPGVGRIHVRRVLRRHDRVAALSAELRRVHVLDAEVGRRAEDQDVQGGRDRDQDHRAPQRRMLEIDLRIHPGQRAGVLERPAPKQDACRHQRESEHEEARQDQVDDDSRVGGERFGIEELEQPEPDHRERGARREHRAQQGDRVTTQIEGGAHPFSNAPIALHVPLLPEKQIRFRPWAAPPA